MSSMQKWDDQANRDLLVAMYEELSPTMAQLTQIAQRVHPLGYTYSAKAV